MNTSALELLRMARCPNTDCIDGGYYGPHGEPIQCQWCAERESALSHAAGQEADEMVRSLPERVWLQVNELADDDDDREPVPRECWGNLSWCYEKIGGHEVEYVRADLTPAQPPASAEVVDLLHRTVLAFRYVYDETCTAGVLRADIERYLAAYSGRKGDAT